MTRPKRIFASVPELLQAICEQAGRTQRAAAKKASVDPSTFNRWIKGRRVPSLTDLRKAAKANGFTVAFKIQATE